MPNRSSCQSLPITLTMVDSIPTLQAPPSSTAICCPKPNSTCAAVVGLNWVNLLADGAASAKPLACNNASAIECAGTRSATVAWLPRTIWLTLLFAVNTSVKGPGQKAVASFCANGGKSSAQLLTCEISLICTINGLSIGRCLMANICRNAASLPASAAKPYTVSVGIATTSPLCNKLTACDKSTRILEYF